MMTAMVTKSELIQLKDMLQNNYALSLDNYFKCLITLAYELLLQDEVSTAQSFLEELPTAYLNHHLPKQLQSDALFNLSFRAFLDLAKEKGLILKSNNFNNIPTLQPKVK
jgi:hypothetical protein